jgi:hypothetical protein
MWRLMFLGNVYREIGFNADNRETGVIMERMIIGIIASALIGLGAWNLNQTFNLSIEIESVKGKIDVLEKSIKQLGKKKNKKGGSIIQQSN